METWSPVVQFIAQYAFAFLAAMCALLCSTRDLSMRRLLGETGKYGLIGGTCAPIFAEFQILPATVSKTAKLLFWSATIGSGVVTVPMVRGLAARLLTSIPTNEKDERDIP